MQGIKVSAESGGVVNTNPFKIDKKVDKLVLENLSKIIAITFKTENKDYSCIDVELILFNDDKNNIYLVIYKYYFSMLMARLLLSDFLRVKKIEKIEEYCFKGTIKKDELENMQCCFREKDELKIINLTNDEMNSYE